MKLIVHAETDKVIGVHMWDYSVFRHVQLLTTAVVNRVGPDAAEIMQGMGIAVKAGATKAIFDSTVGIHPCSAEVGNKRYTVMDLERRCAAGVRDHAAEIETLQRNGDSDSLTPSSRTALLSVFIFTKSILHNPSQHSLVTAVSSWSCRFIEKGQNQFGTVGDITDGLIVHVFIRRISNIADSK